MYSLRTLRVPVVAAPMAGGPSTPALVAAVAGAGGFGFLAAGYQSADALRTAVADLRGLLRPTGRPEFGVNVFAAPGAPADQEVVARYTTSISAEAARLDVALGEPRWDDDAFDAKVELLLADPVGVVSFTFGCPTRGLVDRFHEVDTAVWVTVTTPAEARTAAATGCDALVAQGIEAGGHRGSFAADEPSDYTVLSLLQLLAADEETVHVPTIAAGGIAARGGLEAVLAAGAVAGQIGTALLLCPEAGTNAMHREALVTRRTAGTAPTRAFSGRTARGVVNRFVREHSADAPLAYPEVHHLTNPLRAAARARSDADALHLWAGQTYPLAHSMPVADVVRMLAPTT